MAQFAPTHSRRPPCGSRAATKEQDHAFACQPVSEGSQSDQRRMGAGRLGRDDRRRQSGQRPAPRRRAEVGRGRDAAGHRCRACRVPRMEPDECGPPRRPHAQAARRHHGQSRRARRTPDARTGQAARRGEGRGRDVGLLRAVVRRRGAAGLWRHDPLALGGPADDGDQAAGRRHRRDHAVELSLLDAGPQDRAGAGDRLHQRRQAGDGHALFGSRLGRARRGSRHSEGRDQRSDRILVGDRQGAVHQRQGPEDHLHRLHGSRPRPARAVCRHGEEDIDGAWRQRAVPRLRRRRCRPCGRRRDRGEIPQHRPDLRVHQPVHRPVGHLRDSSSPSLPKRPRR